MKTIYQQLQEHLVSGKALYIGDAYFRREPAPRLTCKDGFHMSVQASEYHYSTPKTNTGPYSEVELWCVSGEEECLKPYGDGSDPYAYLPIQVVEYLIEKHGGFADV